MRTYYTPQIKPCQHISVDSVDNVDNLPVDNVSHVSKSVDNLDA